VVKRRRLIDPRNPRPRLPDPARMPEDPFGPRAVSEHQLSEPVSPRLISFAVIAALAFAGLTVALANLQLKQGTHFASLAEGNRVRQEVVLSPRGILFDRHGAQLVQNQGSFAVGVVPIDLPRQSGERRQVLDKLQAGLRIAPDEVERQVAQHKAEPFQPFVLKGNLDIPTYQYLAENLPSMPGVRLLTGTTRYYPYGAGIGLSHILGYVGKLDPQEYADLHSKGYLLDDSKGKTGMEYFDERWLRGTPGVKVIETDAHGRQVGKPISQTDPVPGDNVYLTLDLDLQKEVTADVQASLNHPRTDFGAFDQLTAGVAVVMNPQNGEIYSLVSLPDYDINLFAKGITTRQYQGLTTDIRLPLLDRAIDGQYPPGSTFKPVTAVAGLSTGAITTSSNIFCPGRLVRGSANFLCWNRGGHGNQNVIQAIAHSCDVFFYTVADNVGDLALNRVAKDFGIGQRTGIDLTPEARGIAPDRDWKKKYFAEALAATGDQAWSDSTWYEGNTITYGIGQSYLLVTPLQDLEWTATIANGGNFWRPQVTGRITSVDSSFKQPFQPYLDHKVTEPAQDVAIAREGMRQAVADRNGTATPTGRLPGVPEPGAKTGSAQYGLPDAKGNFPIHGWFTAFAPATDPEVAVVVFIEGGGEGAVAAQPVVDKILTYYFAHRDAIIKSG
jgi:penicillin-binding protein 2